MLLFHQMEDYTTVSGTIPKFVIRDEQTNDEPDVHTNEHTLLNGETVGTVLAHMALNVTSTVLKNMVFLFILLIIGYLQGSLHLFSVMFGCVIGVTYQSYAVFITMWFFRSNYNLLLEVLDFYRTSIYQGLSELYHKKQK